MDETKATTKRPLILIAEDLDSNFLFLKIVLSKHYDIIWAKDGKEAVDLYEEHRPSLILMDIKMPIMDGLEATRAIRAVSPDIPIIAQTANAFETDHQKAREAGCSDIITKPIKITQLNAIVEKHISTQNCNNIAVEVEKEAVEANYIKD